MKVVRYRQEVVNQDLHDNRSLWNILLSKHGQVVDDGFRVEGQVTEGMAVLLANTVASHLQTRRTPARPQFIKHENAFPKMETALVIGSGCMGTINWWENALFQQRRLWSRRHPALMTWILQGACNKWLIHLISVDSVGRTFKSLLMHFKTVTPRRLVINRQPLRLKWRLL